MNRIEKKFEELGRKKEKALIAFLTAGDPSLKKTEALVEEMANGGVDLVELGVPFSDPQADGPVIQASSQRSLERGTTLKKILRLVARLRQKTELPILLMSYYNPIYRFGLEAFAAKAREAGVDGVILPDVPIDESRAVAAALGKKGLILIPLLTPTSTGSRVRRVAKHAKGFIYYVSIAGVTGVKKAKKDVLADSIRAVKKMTRCPVCVGFGVSTPAIASAISEVADGVIVGSAFVKALNDGPAQSEKAFISRCVKPFARAIGKRLVGK